MSRFYPRPAESRISSFRSRTANVSSQSELVLEGVHTEMKVPGRKNIVKIAIEVMDELSCFALLAIWMFVRASRWVIRIYICILSATIYALSVGMLTTLSSAWARFWRQAT